MKKMLRFVRNSFQKDLSLEHTLFVRIADWNYIVAYMHYFILQMMERLLFLIMDVVANIERWKAKITL